MDDPQDPVAAVTHPDPYPYYARLTTERPFQRDLSLGMWVAAGAREVEQVLASDLCRVRPPSEPVPRALVGSPAAEIFRFLVRMNDGRGHCPFKTAVTAALASVSPTRVAEEGERWARVLAAGQAPDSDARHLQDFAFALSVYVLGTLLGAPAPALPGLSAWTGDLVRGFSPGSPPEQVERCKAAAASLRDFFAPLARDLEGPGLLAELAREARKLGVDDDAVVLANGIGFLSQAYEATAGLIGNTLVALRTHREVRAEVEASPAVLRDVIQEVLRYDPPVQNTRRFAAQRGSVAGREIGEGEVILVVLAAANRDAAANPHPERFDTSRTARRIFTFGMGLHACPGQDLAAAIAEAGVARLLTAGPPRGDRVLAPPRGHQGLDLERLATVASYRPSGNVRIPVFR
jgi:cytochrome P450